MASPELVDAAEKSLLGAALLRREAAEILFTVARGDWSSDRHAAIAEGIGEVLASDAVIDVITVAAAMANTGTEPDLAELRDLIITPPTLSNAHEYATIVRQGARQRRLVLLADDLADAALRGDDDGVRRSYESIGAVL